jgi:hypothetical protein
MLFCASVSGALIKETFATKANTAQHNSICDTAIYWYAENTRLARNAIEEVHTHDKTTGEYGGSTDINRKMAGKYRNVSRRVTGKCR